MIYVVAVMAYGLFMFVLFAQMLSFCEEETFHQCDTHVQIAVLFLFFLLAVAAVVFLFAFVIPFLSGGPACVGWRLRAMAC